jgi:tetratricopeptide (TPR) repeat protein
VFWTLVAATVAGLRGWRRGRQVRRGRKRSATAVLAGSLAAVLAYSDSVWSAAPLGQWQPLAEAAWALGVPPDVARGLGPSAGVRRSIEREFDDDRQGAIREASEAAAARADDSDASLLLAAYHLEAGDLSRAYQAALSAQAARPASGTTLAAVGAVLLARGERELASRALRAAVTRDPGSAAANLVYGCQLAGSDATVESASLFLRRAAAAASVQRLPVSRCLAPVKPYTRARWWASMFQSEYEPRLRQASARVAALPLPPMPAPGSASPVPESLARGGEARR